MIKYKLIIRRIAFADLHEIYEHISRNLNEPVIANKMHADIVKAIRSLTEMPLRHKLVDAEPYHSQGYRMLRVRSYIVFYIVDQENSTVHVVRILYNRRKWQNLL